jgi:hypothetical protein
MSNPVRPKSSTLAPDDIRKGIYVTVTAVRLPEMRRPIPGEPPVPGPRSVAISMAPPAGIPLEVRGVNMPFVVCAIPQPGGKFEGPIVLDLRVVKLMKVSHQYVKSYVSFEAPKPELPFQMPPMPPLPMPSKPE